MANIFIEGSPIENSTEREHQEYVVPFPPKDEELVHNLEVLKNISDSRAIPGEGVLDGVRIGRESYSIKPTEVYTIGGEGQKVFVVREPSSTNEMSFYGYQISPDDTLVGIDASPYLDVHKVVFTMTRKTEGGDVRLDSGEPFVFTHSYPQINIDVCFFYFGFGDIPSTYLLNPTGRMGTLGREMNSFSSVEYGDFPIVAIGRRNREKFYGDKRTYVKLLRSLQRFSSPYGGLQPKEAYLQLALTGDGEYESNFVISI